MSRFIIDSRVFEMIPDVCFGAVVAYGIDNHAVNAKIGAILDKQLEQARERLDGVNLKEYPKIAYYRDAFRAIGINPNRYANSVEALNKRIMNATPFPQVNTIVDLGNAISVKYTLPMGAHDIEKLEGADLEVRPARAADSFVPFGSDAAEPVPEGEIVYVSAGQVRTRRWIWRQSEIGKIDESSSNVVFPIDGFLGKNDDSIRTAMAELSQILTDVLGCRVKSDFLTAEHNFVEL